MNSNLTDRHHEAELFDRVIDLIEHPEQYSAERIDELLSDPEALKIYNLLCKTGSAMHAGKTLSDAAVEKQWERFAATHRQSRASRILPLRLGSRAASIAIVALTSLAAVAIGVAVTAKLSPSEPIAETDIEIITPATVKPAVAVAAPDDTTANTPTPILFEEATLETITEALAKHYGLSVQFNNANAKDLQLYYKFDPSLPIEDVIDQLNTFEQINLRIDGNTLIVD